MEIQRESKKIRSSNFELLRIISILLIIAFHYYVHADYGTVEGSELSINKVWGVLLGSWGPVGVDCFLFISIYFSLNQEKIKWKKCLSIIGETITYSVVLYIVVTIVFGLPVQPKEAVKALIAPISDEYWFVTAFLCIIILSPWLNLIIKNMEKEKLRKLVVTLTLLVSVYRSIYDSAPVDSILFVIYLYLLMGYLKNTPDNWFEKNRKAGFFITAVISVGCTLSISAVGTILHSNTILWWSFRFCHTYSFILVLESIFLFYIFKNMEIKSHPIINRIATTSLGVYLFHENVTLRKVLWDNILQTGRVYQSPLFLFYYIAAVAVLFIVGSLIDFARQGAVRGVILFHDKVHLDMESTYKKIVYRHRQQNRV